MKNRAMKLTLFIISFHIISFNAIASEINCNDLIAESEILWMKYDYDGSEKLLDQAIKLCPDKSESYWRKVRNIYDRIESIPRNNKPEKDALITQYRAMESIGDICIDKDPENGNCLFWKGVAMGRRGTTQGILRSLTEVDELEECFLKAEKLQPQYRSANGANNTLGDTYTALGQLYRLAPEWLCVFPFKQMFGICGDIEKSVGYQRKAVTRESRRIEYIKELGASLLCYGQRKNLPEYVEEAKEMLKSLQTLPEIKLTDAIDKNHAQLLLNNPSLACGYSRDAQQKQSKDAY